MHGQSFFLQMANRYLQHTLGFVEKDIPEPKTFLKVRLPQPICAFDVSFLIEILSKKEALSGYNSDELFMF